MSLAPLVQFATTLNAQLITLAIPILGFCIFVAGAVYAFGNHNHGKERGLAAMVGGAIMLASQTLAASFHA
jgi:Na+/phosphate symporter